MFLILLVNIVPKNFPSFSSHNFNEAAEVYQKINFGLRLYFTQNIL